jgi:hypothetical protein
VTWVVTAIIIPVAKFEVFAASLRAQNAGTDKKLYRRVYIPVLVILYP